MERPCGRQPHRVLLVRPPGPDGRAGQVRLLLPGRGSPAAGAARAGSTTSTWSAGPTPSPCWPPWPRSPTASGLAGTINSTFNEPYEVARQFASLDHLSGAGRRGTWSPRGTPSPGRTSAGADSSPRPNGTSGPSEFLPRPGAAGTPGHDDDVVADPASGRFLRRRRRRHLRAPRRPVRHRRPFNVPRQPQGRPGDLPGRGLRRGPGVRRLRGRRHLLPARHPGGRPARSTPTSRAGWPATAGARGRAQDPAGRHLRARRHRGRGPGAGGRSSAASRSAGQTAILFLEQVWNRDLSGLDPDGPLPDFDPHGSARQPSSRAGPTSPRDPLPTAPEWRELAEAKQLSIRELMIEVTGRQSFVGTPAPVADQIDSSSRPTRPTVSSWSPTSPPGGLDRFADEVVPLLQERGVFRDRLHGQTLRDHLGLAPPPPSSAGQPRRGHRHERSPLPRCARPGAGRFGFHRRPKRCGNSIDLAQRAEDLATAATGSPSTTSTPEWPAPPQRWSSPWSAGATRTIRLGSGGVQMRPSDALVGGGGVRATATPLFPGRIDLGLGRSGGRNFLAEKNGNGRPAQDNGQAHPASVNGGPSGGARPDGGTRMVDGLRIPPKFSPAGLAASPRFKANCPTPPAARSPDSTLR